MGILVKTIESKIKIIGFNLLLFVLIYALSGCVVRDTWVFLTPEGEPNDNDANNVYAKILLKESTSADVLLQIHLPKYELLSQSKSVVASYGQKKDGYKRWFKLVAFDENQLTAQRKYLFIEDERPKILFVEPWEGLAFDCEQVLTPEVLGKPYADENTRRVEILKWMQKNFQKDVGEVAGDNRELEICGSLVNQAIETVLVKLDSAPALAVRLSEKQGVLFEHVNFDKGRIRLVIKDDITTIKLRLGSYIKQM
jgi:hypothetical protein